MATITLSRAGIAVFNNASDIIAQPVLLQRLRWVSPAAAAGDLMEMDDADGNIVMIGVADGPYYTDVETIGQLVNGLTAKTLNSGRVVAYCVPQQ